MDIVEAIRLAEAWEPLIRARPEGEIQTALDNTFVWLWRRFEGQHIVLALALNKRNGIHEELMFMDLGRSVVGDKVRHVHCAHSELEALMDLRSLRHRMRQGEEFRLLAVETLERVSAKLTASDDETVRGVKKRNHEWIVKDDVRSRLLKAGRARN